VESVGGRCGRLQDGCVVCVAEVLVVVQYSVLVVTGGCTGVWWCEGGMYRVVGSSVCGGSSGPVVSAGHAGVDVGASAGLEVVDGFCCLGGVLGVVFGDASAAVEARFRVGWSSWCHCLPVGICHWLGEAGCVAAVCEVVCYMEVGPGLWETKVRWRFGEQRWECLVS